MRNWRAISRWQNLQRLFIGDHDAASINRDQAVVLQPRQRPRHDFAHRADARRNLLVGQGQRDLQSVVCSAASRSGLDQQPTRQPLVNFAKRQCFDQFGAFSQPPGQQLQRGQRDLRARQTQRFHVVFIEEKNDGFFFSGYGGRIGLVVEGGQFGDGRAFAFDVDHLLAPINAFAERAQRAPDDDKQPARLIAGDEQYLVAR